MKLIRLRLGNNRDVWALQQTTHNPNQRFHLQHMTHNCIVCWWFQVRWCGRLTSWLACIVRHCETRRIKPHSSPTTQRLSHYCRERTREASLWCKMSFFLFICCNNDVKRAESSCSSRCFSSCSCICDLRDQFIVHVEAAQSVLSVFLCIETDLISSVRLFLYIYIFIDRPWHTGCSSEVKGAFCGFGEEVLTRREKNLHQQTLFVLMTE